MILRIKPLQISAKLEKTRFESMKKQGNVYAIGKNCPWVCTAPFSVILFNLYRTYRSRVPLSSNPVIPPRDRKYTSGDHKGDDKRDQEQSRPGKGGYQQRRQKLAQKHRHGTEADIQSLLFRRALVNNQTVKQRRGTTKSQSGEKYRDP